MTALNQDDPDLQPQPCDTAPRPTQRTSSPSLDNILDPLLSLTPDKPHRVLGEVRAKNVAFQVEGPGCGMQEAHNTKSAAPPARRDGGEKGKVGIVASAHPEVLFQPERTNQKALLEKNLKIIRHQSKNRATKPNKTEGPSKENRVTAKFDKLTKPSKPSTAEISTKKAKKSVIRKSGRDQPSRGKNKKHVRIVDEKSPLADPQPHSTVVLGHQLTELKAQTFDPEEVVMKTLQDSESARTALNEKVAEAANFSKNEKKYSGLVSVSVPVDEVLQRVVSQRTSQVKRRPTKPTKPSEVPPPDILDMFSPSMIVEYANLDASRLGPPKVKPAPVDPDMTFDLYRHMQCWDLGH